MSYKGKKVLVTGAGGFIGSHLAERLVDEGAQVRGLVHYNSLGTSGWLDTSEKRGDMEIIAGDVRDRDFINRLLKDIDVVFHLAALIGIPYSYSAPSSYVQTNIVGSLNVFQAALDNELEKVVFTSSSEVYGTARYTPIDEDHPLQGQSPYSATKIGGEKLAESFYRSFGLPVAIIRPFNTYGPRQSARALIPTVIAQALSLPSIHVGNTAPTRDLLFVSDTVEGFLEVGASSKSIGEVINVGTGKEISVGGLIELVKKILGKDLPIEVDEERIRPITSEVDRLLAETSKAKKLLDWESKIEIEEGLRKTIPWIEENIASYQPSVYRV